MGHRKAPLRGKLTKFWATSAMIFSFFSTDISIVNVNVTSFAPKAENGCGPIFIAERPTFGMEHFGLRITQALSMCHTRTITLSPRCCPGAVQLQVGPVQQARADTNSPTVMITLLACTLLTGIGIQERHCVQYLHHVTLCAFQTTCKS